MNISINTQLDNLLELWAMNSYKLYSKQSDTKEILEQLKSVTEVLDKIGVERVELFNLSESIFSLRYYKHGNECIKDYEISSFI